MQRGTLETWDNWSGWRGDTTLPKKELHRWRWSGSGLRLLHCQQTSVIFPPRHRLILHMCVRQYLWTWVYPFCLQCIKLIIASNNSYFQTILLSGRRWSLPMWDVNKLLAQESQICESFKDVDKHQKDSFQLVLFPATFGEGKYGEFPWNKETKIVKQLAEFSCSYWSRQAWPPKASGLGNLTYFGASP